MRKTKPIFTIIILFTLLLNGCSNNSKEEQGSSIEKDSLNKNEPKKKRKLQSLNISDYSRF